MLSNVDLTEKQKKYLLFVMSSGESLKDCATKLGISDVSLSNLITRVDKKYPGFRDRLHKLRRVTHGKEHRQPKEIPWGALKAVPYEEKPYLLYGRPHKAEEINLLQDDEEKHNWDLQND